MSRDEPQSAEQAPGVVSVGMVSSIGLSAAECCAAIRGRISRFEEIPFRDLGGEPIIAAPATEAVLGRQGDRRLAPLLAGALRDCLGDAPSLPPLFVAVDGPDRPDYCPDVIRRLPAQTEQLLELPLPQDTRVFAEGTTGFFRALDAARELLRQNGASGCIVAAVDSLLHGTALDWLQSGQRLKTEANSDGVIPGEAAAAVWLVPADRLSPDRPGLARILGIGYGDEATVREPDTPNLAEGLADALRAAADDAGLGFEDIDFRVGGVGGERTAFMEASTAMARVLRTRKETFELLLPAEKLGDTGAAAGACMLVSTAVAFAKGYAPGATAILFLSAPSGARAACVAQRWPKEQTGDG